MWRPMWRQWLITLSAKPRGFHLAPRELLGPSLTLPVRDDALALGTWQGIYLREHRDHGGPRTVIATLQGE